MDGTEAILAIDAHNALGYSFSAVLFISLAVAIREFGKTMGNALITINTAHATLDRFRNPGSYRRVPLLLRIRVID